MTSKMRSLEAVSKPLSRFLSTIPKRSLIPMCQSQYLTITWFPLVTLKVNSKRCTTRATLACSDRKNLSEPFPALPQANAASTLTAQKTSKHSGAATGMLLTLHLSFSAHDWFLFELLCHFVRLHLPSRDGAGITSENGNQKTLSIL